MLEPVSSNWFQSGNNLLHSYSSKLLKSLLLPDLCGMLCNFTAFINNVSGLCFSLHDTNQYQLAQIRNFSVRFFFFFGQNRQINWSFFVEILNISKALIKFCLFSILILDSSLGGLIASFLFFFFFSLVRNVSLLFLFNVEMPWIYTNSPPLSCSQKILVFI